MLATIKFSRFAVLFITAKGGKRLEPNPALLTSPLARSQAKRAGGGALTRYHRCQFTHGTRSTRKVAAWCVDRGVGALINSAPALFNFIHRRLKSVRSQGRALISAGSANFMAKLTQVMSKKWDRGPCLSLCHLPA